MSSLFTRFDEKLLELRRQWSGCAIAPGYAWKRAGPNGSYESGAFDVVDLKSGQKGIAKPGVIKLSDVARAAHEKIVADLAALPQIDLPVPPVMLYDRGESATKDRFNQKRERVDSPRYVAISALAYSVCDHATFQKLTAEQKQSILAPFSAMAVFEAWIAAGNAHLGHVLIDVSVDPPRLAWIDHAHSLSQQWEWEKTGTPIRTMSWYLPGFAPDKNVMKHVSGRIASVSDGEIETIVSRIGFEWLSEARRDLIIEKLKQRRDAIGRAA